MGRFHEEGLVQIFMLYDMQWGGIEVIQAIAELNNQAKLNKLENYQENKPLVSSKHPPTEIIIDH